MLNYIDRDIVGIFFRRQLPDSMPISYYVCDSWMSDGFIRSDNNGAETVAPLYVYARLYSPNYRKSYEKYRKRDYPRVPYPSSLDEFKVYVAYGRRLIYNCKEMLMRTMIMRL